MQKYDVIIFDGNNTAHKAYHVNKYLSIKLEDGTEVHTGIIYGFLNMMLNVYSQFGYNGTKIMVCWDSIDSAESNKEINANYKSNRTPQTESELQDKIRFTQMMNSVKTTLCSLNILQFEKHKCEADDLVASIVSRINKDLNILIITEDKDYRQLISDNIHLYGISQKLLWDKKVFKQKTGLFKPTHFVDYLAIVGDSIDNFGGVQGFGHAKAMKILTDEMFSETEYVSREILANPESVIEDTQLSDREKALFIKNISDLETSFKLAKLDTTISTCSLINDRYKIKGDMNAFKNILSFYQIKSMLKPKELQLFENIKNATKYKGDIDV